jgi:hypothetical protein
MFSVKYEMFFPKEKSMDLLKCSQTSGACSNDRIIKMKMMWNNGGEILEGKNQRFGGKSHSISRCPAEIQCELSWD